MTGIILSVAYDFRIRASLGNTVKIESPHAEVEVFHEGQVRVIIRSLDGESPLTDSRDIAIRGTGYESKDEALREGDRWRGHVTVGFARINLGVDFGERAPTGGLSEWLLEKVRAEHPDIQIYNDAPGVLVFPTDPPALFSRGQASAVVGKMEADVISAIQKARERDAGLDDRHRLAYDLYSASFSQPAADARFLMLTMALETIIDQQPRSNAVREQIDTLISTIKDSDLDQPSVDSIIGGLRDLKRESVGQAGRRLAMTLGGRTYFDKPAVKFFTYCYNLRSHLVHGHYPRPSWTEVSVAAAHLERFVGDLLGIALLDDFPWGAS